MASDGSPQDPRFPHDRWISESLRPVDEVTKPAFLLPSGACDCHMHVFGPAELYPGVSDARYTLPEGSVVQYRAIADLFGLERAVFVQPSYYGVDNSCLLDGMRRFGRSCRGVIFLPDHVAPRDIDALHQLGVRGIRLDFFKADSAQWSITAIAAELRRAADIARDADWHLELYSPGYVTCRLFEMLANLEVDFSVNHLGYMKAERGVTEADFVRFVELAMMPHCWVKLTGPYRVASEDQKSLTDWMAKRLIAAAPDRVVWGTDWPHLPHGSRDTGELLNRLMDWCPSENDRHKVLVRNPARLYHFD